MPTKPLTPFHVKEFYVREFYNLVGEYFTDVEEFYQASSLWDFATVSAARLLSCLPRGEQIKEVVKRIIYPKGEYVEKEEQNLQGKIKQEFAVLPFREKFLSLPPLVLLAVGRKSSSFI